MGSNTCRLALTLLAIVLGCGPPPNTGQQHQHEPSTGGSQQRSPDSAVQVAAGVSYVLEDGEESNRAYPETFEIPSKEARDSLKAGQIVKLMFRITADGKTQTERMWVVVKAKEQNGYRGILDNDPTCTEKMKSGLEVNFQPRHVISIYEERGESDGGASSEEGH